MTTIPAKPPATHADVPTEWTDMVRAMIVRDGIAFRPGGGAGPTIELKSLTTNQWLPLMLPGGGTVFATHEDRNHVLGRLQ